MKQDVDLVERTGPEIFRFDKPGDSLRGRLITIDAVEVSGKPTTRFVFEDLDEERTYAVLGTVELLTKIRKTDLGQVFQIRFEGADSKADNGKHPIKRFKVFVERPK